uniref:S100/CaBP-9k-type calcium binding subdomain domain-containing protein n=1 Tax=Nothobranchius furzeri TaxID=105023 RepID=A0A8C6PQP8_NOTFU
MARLEQAITSIVDVFSEYASSDCKLNKQELKKMMEKEVQSPELKAKICSGDGDNIPWKLDRNLDRELDFKEFMNGVTTMAKCYYQKKTEIRLHRGLDPHFKACSGFMK